MSDGRFIGEEKPRGIQSERRIARLGLFVFLMQTYWIGDSVYLMSDPHSGPAIVSRIPDEKGLMKIKWPSGVEETVHESEVRFS